MKRFASLTLALLWLLSACGAPTESASAESVAAESVVPTIYSAAKDGYIVPESWKEVSVDDGTWGYVTSEGTEVLPEGLPENCVSEGDYYYILEDLTLTCYQSDGSQLCSFTVPAMGQDPGDGSWSEYLSTLCFGDEALWMLHSCYDVVDMETGQTDETYNLECWDFSGQQRAVISLQDALGLSQDDFISDLALSPQGTPVVISRDGIWFLDDSGSVVASADTEGLWYSFCRDQSSRLYLKDDGSYVYTVDWDNHAIGQQLFSLSLNEQVLPGGGPYDFLLSSDTALRGVSLESGTITEILSWADCDLAGSVGSVTYVDEDTFLIHIYGLLSDMEQTLTLKRVPADMIPEKTVVQLVVPLQEIPEDPDRSWSKSLNQMVTEAMNAFNRSSSTYRVEVDTFASATELQLLMTVGDAPDLIYWSGDWLEDPPSAQLYAKKGFLTDLEPLIQADEELSMEDFIPSVMTLAKETYGGLYVIPTSYYLRTMVGLTEYVGQDMGWSLQDLLTVAEQLPEDMILANGFSQQDFLSMLLDVNLSQFADVVQGTCQFETQAFYDLLTLCRDYFPAEYQESDATPLLYVEATLGRLGQFASDVMRPLKEEGKTLIGYPGAEGNGTNLVFFNVFSICSLGSHQEGAWLFLRTLLAYDFQYSGISNMNSIRWDALDAIEDKYLEINGSCTKEESLAARQLIYDAGCLTVYDSPVAQIVLEEAAACFAGDKTPEETAAIIQNRVEIYLGEQS